jgi:alkanesulfonate monooxygenase SsuD/methylene tetrahydromethanopterin reductase-like flavin-dependent oxidoreductase (luciferase family)
LEENMASKNQALEIGVLLHTAGMTGDSVSVPDLSPLWEQTMLVEDLGYASAWVGDSSRTETAWPRADCVSLMTAMAMKTSKLKLGTVPLSVPLRNPVLLAHSLATVDVISNGRLAIGASIGKSGPMGAQEYVACGVPQSERGARLSEALQLMRGLWTEEAMEFNGKFYSLLGETGIRPMPLQKPIPLYVCANGAEAGFKRVARYGDGWFTTSRDPTVFADHRRKIDEYAREVGREGATDKTALFATFHLDSDGDKAREDAGRHLTAYFGGHHQSGASAGFFGSPLEVAARLQTMVDGGLTSVVARIVCSDLEGQAKLLLGEMLPMIAPRPLGSRLDPATVFD